MQTVRLIAIAGAALAASWVPVAAAAPIRFDCDTPATRSSTLDMALVGKPGIGAVITPLEFRAGNTPSLGGLRLVAGDGSSGVAVQMIIPAGDAKDLNVVVLVQAGGKMQTIPVGTIPIGKPDPHTVSLALAPQGKAVLTIDGKAWSVDYPAPAQLSGGAFCASSHFGFGNLAQLP